MNLRKGFMGRLEKKKRGNEVILFQKIATRYIDIHTGRYIDRKKENEVSVLLNCLLSEQFTMSIVCVGCLFACLQFEPNWVF